MPMNTRSKAGTNNEQSESKKSPISNENNIPKITQSTNKPEIVRCDECDNDINSKKAELFRKVYVCHSCFKKYQEKEESSSNFLSGNKGIVIVAFLGVLVTVASYCVTFDSSYFLDILSLQNTQLDEFDCRNDTILLNSLDDILKNFPSQSENTLFTFAAGIKRIYDTNPTEPTSFLLLHKDGDKTANCLVKKISKIAANCLTKTNNMVILNGEQLKNEPFISDSGELIEIYKPEVKEKKVMLVYDINQIPGNVIKEFHYFCDTYSPLVNEAVYFFTMSIDDDLTNNIKPVKRAENKFRELWSTSLDYNLLDPLITRMTTNIIPIFSESDYKNDC